MPIQRLNIAPTKPKIALAMIVKNEFDSNESKIIRRCLDSLLGIVDYIAIVGNHTHEQGDTLEIAAAWCLENNVPCVMQEEIWDQDFSKMRNIALRLAQEVGCDWIWVGIDADEWAKTTKEHIHHMIRSTEADAIAVPMQMADGKINPRLILIKNLPGWAWKYKIHESIEYDDAPAKAVFFRGGDGQGTPLPIIYTAQDGARTMNPKKLDLDIQSLHEFFVETNDYRYLFYMAETEFSRTRFLATTTTEDLEQIIGHFKKYIEESHTIQMGLIYRSYLNVGRILSSLGRTQEAVVSFLTAYNTCPSRVEALGEIACIYSSQKAFAMAKVYALACAHTPEPDPNHQEYLEVDWTEWKGLLLLAEAAFMLRQNQAAEQYLTILLDRKGTPDFCLDHAKSIMDKMKEVQS